MIHFGSWPKPWQADDGSRPEEPVRKSGGRYAGRSRSKAPWDLFADCLDDFDCVGRHSKPRRKGGSAAAKAVSRPRRESTQKMRDFVDSIEAETGMVFHGRITDFDDCRKYIDRFMKKRRKTKIIKLTKKSK